MDSDADDEDVLKIKLVVTNFYFYLWIQTNRNPLKKNSPGPVTSFGRRGSTCVAYFAQG